MSDEQLRHRYLTQGEWRLAESVFGDQLDTEFLRVGNNAPGVLGSTRTFYQVQTIFRSDSACEIDSHSLESPWLHGDFIQELANVRQEKQKVGRQQLSDRDGGIVDKFDCNKPYSGKPDSRPQPTTTSMRVFKWSPFFAFGLFMTAMIDSAHSTDQLQESLEREVNYLSISDCVRAWDVIWQDFLDGSPEASAAAAIFIVHRNLRIPRFSHDYSTIVRDIAFFSFNSVGASEQMERHIDVIIDILHRDYPGLRERQSIYGNLCSADFAPSRECLSRLEADQILPTPGDFVLEVRSAQNASIDAYCAD